MAGRGTEWSLRNTGLYLFGTQALMSSGMLVMIAAYIVVGYYKFHNVGNGAIEYGNFGYPKTGFLPFGSTVWTLSVLMVLTAMDLGIAIAAFTSAVESTKGGLGVFVAAKVIIILLYLVVFGLTTEWMGSEVAVAICYLAFSLAATYVALLLFGALSSGGAAAVEAGFSDEGLESPSSDDSRASREKERGGYQTSGLESKYV
jgi:hypothetical protein